MRLSDAGLRQRPTKLLYPNHRLPPWLSEDAPRDRSNRLLDPALPKKARIRVLIHKHHEVFDGCDIWSRLIPVPFQITTQPKYLPVVSRSNIRGLCSAMFEFLARAATPYGTYLEYSDALPGNAE
jgi:hypothetical protein